MTIKVLNRRDGRDGDGPANLPLSLAVGLASRLQGGKEISFIFQLFEDPE